MWTIIEFLYSGILVFPPEEAVMIIKNLDYLGIECETLLNKMLNDENCVQLYVLTDEIERMDLKEIAIGYIRENLKQIINNSAFKELTKNQLQYILSRVDNPDADVMYEIAIQWLKHDEQRRGSFSEQILQYVPVDDLSLSLISNQIMNEEFLKTNSGGCRWLMSSLMDNRTRFSVSVLEKRAIFYIMSRGLQTYMYEFNELEGSLIKAHYRPELSYSSMTMYKNMIYVVGGYRGSVLSDVGLRYDTKDRVWTEFKCKVGKICCGTCTRHNQMLLIGGLIEGVFQSSCSSYDYDIGRWIELPNLTQRRSRPGVSVYNSSIYVFGGIDANDYPKIIERYDPREGQWFNAGVLDFRSGCSSAVLSDSIYCLKTGTKDLVRYDPRILHHTPIYSLSVNSRSIGTRDDVLYLLNNKGMESYAAGKDSWAKILAYTFDDHPIFVV
ncbi:kelch-like protein 12 isoform X2 [Hermetia illucens]|nr:kelch-like protein 12 isoform X2 [Hermetia illucens]